MSLYDTLYSEHRASIWGADGRVTPFSQLCTVLVLTLSDFATSFINKPALTLAAFKEILSTSVTSYSKLQFTLGELMGIKNQFTLGELQVNYTPRTHVCQPLKRKFFHSKGIFF